MNYLFIKQRVESLFEYWLNDISQDNRIYNIDPLPTISVIQDTNKEKTAQVWLRNPPLIEIFSSFLTQIEAEVENNKEIIIDTCFHQLTFSTLKYKLEPMILDYVNELSISFALLHEIFHILCGHVGDFQGRSANDGSIPFDEDLPEPVINSDQDSLSIDYIPEEILRIYFMEVEADNTALQWLMQSPIQDAFRDILNNFETVNKETCIFELNDEVRFFAFRILLISLWLVIRLIERNRGPKLVLFSEHHPFPSARLLAAVCTLAEQFVEFGQPEYNTKGGKLYILTEKNADNLRDFLNIVLKPILKKPWPIYDKSAYKDMIEASPVWLTTEIKNIILQEQCDAKPAIVLEKIEKIRSDMIDKLQPHRYFFYGA